MNTLTVKLRQHTPLIQFQADQEGATLRASEVKPRLDKFIKSIISYEQYKQWIKDEDKPSLKYQMRIDRQSMVRIEKNIINETKNLCLFSGIIITIKSQHYDLIEIIKNNICNFFIINNFGFRQSKGYGSFTVEKINKAPIEIDYIELAEALCKHFYNKVIYKELEYNKDNKFATFYSDLFKPDRAFYNRLDDNTKKRIRFKYKIQNRFLTLMNDFPFFAQRVDLLNDFEKEIEKHKKILKELITDADTIENIFDNAAKKISTTQKELLFHYHSVIFDICEKEYKLLKSGDSRNDIKPAIFNYFIDKTNWEKRFIKQNITRVNPQQLYQVGLEGGGRNLTAKPDVADSKYNYIRALLGLADNFEFKTNDSRKKLIVKVKSISENEERFQSTLFYKIVDNYIFICLKKEEVLNTILNKNFKLTLSCKEQRGNANVQFGNEVFLGNISTPSSEDFTVSDFYTYILNYFESKQYQNISTL